MISNLPLLTICVISSLVAGSSDWNDAMVVSCADSMEVMGHPPIDYTYMESRLSQKACRILKESSATGDISESNAKGSAGH